MPRCPVCDAAVDLVRTPTAPFCSDRCRLVDLGRWLDEGYAVPVRPPDADDEDADEAHADQSSADPDES